LPPSAPIAVLIGNSNAGGFGHDWDQAWLSIPKVEVVAVADVQEKGRAEAKKRTGAPRAYAYYREMLAKEKPDIATICPRTLDERVAMVEAAAQAKAHPYGEALPARSTTHAAWCRPAGQRRAAGWATARAFTVTSEAKKMIAAGAIGVIQEMRARGKEDRRAGGEDLMVLGTHCFDLMRYFAGDPEWCFAHITEQDRELSPAMMRKATEPIGDVGGDNVAAMFGFRNGVHGYFASKSKTAPMAKRFGVTITATGNALSAIERCSAGLRCGAPPEPPENGERWERALPRRHKARHSPGDKQTAGARLLEAIENNRQPIAAPDGYWTVAMVDAIYRSQASGGRVKLAGAGA
jgi:predicted dehydrogenase